MAEYIRIAFFAVVILFCALGACALAVQALRSKKEGWREWWTIPTLSVGTFCGVIAAVLSAVLAVIEYPHILA